MEQTPRISKNSSKIPINCINQINNLKDKSSDFSEVIPNDYSIPPNLFHHTCTTDYALDGKTTEILCWGCKVWECRTESAVYYGDVEFKI